MKTNELYLKVLEDIRFRVLKTSCTLNDFRTDEKAYDLLCQVNSACNMLSSLIDIMRYER